MATRLVEPKPDPAITRQIRRARATMPRARDARALIVGASLILTVGGAALVANQDAQAQAAAQAATATSGATTTQSANGVDLLGGLGGIPATLGSWWEAISGGAQTLAQDAGSTVAASTTTSTPRPRTTATTRKKRR